MQDAELIFWILLFAAALVILATIAHAGSTNNQKIDDLEAWNRNYSRTKNRRNW